MAATNFHATLGEGLRIVGGLGPACTGMVVDQELYRVYAVLPPHSLMQRQVADAVESEVLVVWISTSVNK